jgi:glycosyltransferase involved in cell wall biosynthesis
MAMGLPTVAFDTPVQREYLAELGVYAPPGDLDAFTDAIRTLLGDPARRAKLGRELRQRAVDHYSWEQTGQQIVSIYDRYCRRNGQ